MNDITVFSSVVITELNIIFPLLFSLGSISNRKLVFKENLLGCNNGVFHADYLGYNTSMQSQVQVLLFIDGISATN